VAEAGKVVKTPRSVLLVCQNDATTGMLAAILGQNNETVLTAQNIKDAWECLKTGVVGCVVQDFTTPLLESLTLFRAARSTQATCQVPFLFLVKKDVKIVPLERIGPETTRDSWLALPCSGQLFLTAIRSLLDQKSVRDTQVLSPVWAAAAAAPAPEKNAAEPAQPADPGVFLGQLGLLDVTKILSMLEPLRLTGLLRLADGKRQGAIFFIEGAVRHAELNEIEGPDALFLLFHLKTGSFRFEVDVPTAKRTIEGNTMQLLLEGLRQMDEAKAMVRAFQQRRAGTPAQNAGVPD
jgi:CheY-like chemotaxis protein